MILYEKRDDQCQYKGGAAGKKEGEGKTTNLDISIGIRSNAKREINAGELLIV